ncbi:MAG: CDP-alcohol phosphatidyltransferase family protein [Ignavibacteriae bacterium]|nr:CDP-alcohol phosphatidyltransferase family protein [Ignavibacteriota bacterium]
MASIYDLKPAFQNLLRPITRFLAKIGVTANQVTLCATILSLVVGGIICWYNSLNAVLFIVPVFLFIRMALNAIDGMLAREFKMKSHLGSFLNELGDVISDTALYLPFAFIPGIPSKLIILIVILSIITEVTGINALQIGARRRYDGPMGKSDRAFWFGLIAILIACGVSKGVWIIIMLWGICILLIVTIFNRVRKALKEVS